MQAARGKVVRHIRRAAEKAREKNECYNTGLPHTGRGVRERLTPLDRGYVLRRDLDRVRRRWCLASGGRRRCRVGMRGGRRSRNRGGVGVRVVVGARLPGLGDSRRPGNGGWDSGGRGRRGAVLLSDHRLEVAEIVRLDVEDPLEVPTHLALHLVDLAEGEHTLTDDAPGLVRVGVVADDLGRNHERRDVEAVAG